MMNKIIVALTSIVILSATGLFAQKSVEITGVLQTKKPKTLKLFKIEEGRLTEFATAMPQQGGLFGFVFYPEYEGFYLLGTGNDINPVDNHKFYFKPGDKLSLSISDSTYVLTGKGNSKENTVLTQWHDLVYPIERKSIYFMRTTSTYVDFFPQLEEVSRKAKSFLAVKATGNPTFDRKMQKNMEWDMVSFATNFLNTPRSTHPTVEQYSPYYATLRAQDFGKTASEVYAQPWGQRILGALISVNMRQQQLKLATGAEGLKNILSFIPNDTLKGDFVLENAARLKSFKELQDLTGAFSSYVLTKSQQEKVRNMEANLASFKPGSPAFAFSYPDNNGKTVTMASLKGKVVLVDVWATWCGPCKAEIPHLKKLEEEMKGTDVQVVSISVDEAKDKEKWLKMIKDMNLGGLQLFASGWGDLAKYYKITGIPRFMVFDREGKIVTVDSPRPSNPELKKLLEQTLAVKMGSGH